jgi:large subunit ribosomal protein LX
MAKRVFRVKGSFRATHHDQPFSKEVVAADGAAAKEYIFSLFGSKHGVPRRLMTIERVDEVPADQIEDPVVRHAAGLNA